jgi:tRNA (cytidine32/uridine32-2'-O)-methyltransferase
LNLDNIRIVLIEPQHPGNIGAVARAMKTMAMKSLYIVRPKNYPSHDAERRAVGAIDTLIAAKVVDDLQDAVRDCPMVVATTSRNRAHPHPILDARTCGETLVAAATDEAPVAVLFGPERTGISTHDMDACNFQFSIPTNPEFASLNLASAVQLLCYEIFIASGQYREPDSKSIDYPPQSDTEFFYQQLEMALDSRGFFSDASREITLVKIRRLFGRSRPRVGELKLLHTLVKLMRRDLG